VTLNGRRLYLPQSRRANARTLLIWLLLHPETVFRGTELAELLWPGQADRNRIHVTLHQLRRSLEPDLPPRRPSTFIRSDQTGYYRFDLAGRWWTDVADVERLWQQARTAEGTGDIQAAISAYEQMLDYYGRTFLVEDAYCDVFDNLRFEQERRHDHALQRSLQLHLGMGDDYQALSRAIAILDRNPYSEDAVTASVRVKLRQGNRRGAIAQLEDFLWTVERELGIAPSPHLFELRDTIARVR
jgi:DNA-binding SARP family transcriptional activator